MRRLWVWIAFLLGCGLAVDAQSAPQTAQQTAPPPLAEALHTTPIPARDRVELARRLRGVAAVAAPPTAAPSRNVGERMVFSVIDTAQEQLYEVPAVLRVVGDHLYLWVQQDRQAEIENAPLQALADAFDDTIYDSVRALWGSENTPGIDGETRIHGLFTDAVGVNAAAYFMSDNTVPRAAFPTSNERDMFLFNLNVFLNYPAREIESVVAHEFQHMIRHSVQPNEETWANEGLSEFTQSYLYDLQTFEIDSFLQRPATQLNTWGVGDGSRSPNYGATGLFFIYLYERYGLEAIQRFSADSAPRALVSLDNTLRQAGSAQTADAFFADWVAANAVDGAAPYGYQGFDYPVEAVAMTPVVRLPFEVTDSVPQYATHYYDLSAARIPAGSPVTLRLDAPTETGAIPVEAAGGRNLWYSNRADLSDTTLTRAFDLRGVTSASLEYRVWFALEEYWDYGYLMVSADGGSTWEMLTTPHMTAPTNNGAAYGVGYTGRSGEWLDEQVSLDAYAGGIILVRFEVITDDSINDAGLALDDVKVSSIGYTSSFEDDGGGWQSDGWLWTDNRMPQRAWVQVITRRTDGETAVERWLYPDDGASWTFIQTDEAYTILAVSPVAPVTTVPMPYVLSLSPGD
ncbi:MAG: immune inhibitor A [bacterium]|nr:immune inhibitor A [bacterium]